jgi:hypothetical protein
VAGIKIKLNQTSNHTPKSMYKSFRNLTMTLIALFSTLAGVKAQTNVIYSGKNGHGKIILSTTISNMDSTKVAIRQVMVSNNPSMIPIIQGKDDSVTNNVRTFTDTLSVSVSFPTYFYISERVITRDTTGMLDTASAISYIVLVVTPPFSKPTETIQSPTVGTTTATILADFNSGYDTAYVVVTVSYGDTTYANPYTAYRDTIFPVIGQANQVVSKPITLAINSPSYKFSGKVKIWNSKGDTTSGKFSGITLPNAAPAMVSSPYAISIGTDSIGYTDQTVTNGLKTRHVAYLYASATGPAIDSIVVIYPGSNTVIVTRNHFKNLNSATNYWINSMVIDTAFKVAKPSNKVLVQTLAKPAIFTLKIDSNKYFGSNTQRAYFTNITPSGHTGSAYVVLTTYVDQNTTLYASSTQTFGSGVNKFTVDFTNLSVGEKYAYTVMGYDVPYSDSYSAWRLTDSFTFVKPNTDVTIDSIYAPSVTLSSLSFKVDVRLKGTQGVVRGYISKSSSGPAIDSAESTINSMTGVYTKTFNFGADSSTLYYFWAEASSKDANAVVYTTTRKSIKTLTPVTPPKPPAEPIMIVDSTYTKGTFSQYVAITIIVPTGKTFDLWAEAALNPDTGFVGSFQINKIATVGSGVHYYTWQINGLYDGQTIYYTLYGTNSDTSLYIERKSRKGFFVFHKMPGVGIGLNQSSSKLNVYPNPATDLVHIPSTGSYVLTNALGQILETGLLSDNSPLNVEELETGFYYVKTGNGTYKFLKK